MKGPEVVRVSVRSIAVAACGLALVWGAWAFTRADPSATAPDSAAASLSPAEARQQEILKANVGKPGDPDLMAQYASISARYFGGELPELAVRWEPALADVGPLSGQGFTLQGMFGVAGRDALILLSPVLQPDARAVERAFCHEIVHAYLFAKGDVTSNHGQPFQAELERLSALGAFEGIASNDDERRRLKAWLDTESIRIDEERRIMDALDEELRQIGADIDRDITAFNARAERPVQEADALEARRTLFNHRVLDANDRIQRDRDDLAHFNREVDRYNLMMAYPDGLDEAATVQAKPTRPATSGR